MLWRKPLAVVGVVLTIAGLSRAQQWRPAGASPDGWKASAATLGVPNVPTVSTFRRVEQTSSLDPAPVRSAQFDDRDPPPDFLPPYQEIMPAPKASLGAPGTLPRTGAAYPGVVPPAIVPGTPAGPPGFDPSMMFRPRGRVWVTPEYLMWRTSGMYIPPIATASPVGTSLAQTGVLGNPGTRLLFGDQKILNDWRSGIRVGTGFWFDDEQTVGIDATFLYLGIKQKNFGVTSPGDPLLARPYTDATTGLPSSQVVTFTNSNAGVNSPAQVGTIGFRATSSFWGADVNLRRNLWQDSDLRIDGLFGFRFLQLRDKLEVGSNFQANDPNAAAGIAFGTTFSGMDTFNTRSDFFGGQVGLKGEYNMGRWSIGMLGKVALGSSIHDVSINGFSTTTPANGGPATTSVGGLYAQPTNIGHYSGNSFAVVPEFGINLSYQMTDQIRLFVGYSGLYWSNVVRAGQQIDTTVNSTQIPTTTGSNTLFGQARPAYIMRETGFWASGANIGLEFRW